MGYVRQQFTKTDQSSSISLDNCRRGEKKMIIGFQEIEAY